MTRYEVIRLAESAGWDMHDGPDGFTDRLERFAALVAAAEREECAKVAEEHYNYYGCDFIADAIRARGNV